MFFDDPGGASTPFIPPLPSPEQAPQPPVLPTPDHGELHPAWAQQPRTPLHYPYYPATPSNTTPFIPPMPPSAIGTPNYPRTDPPGSYYPAPSALPMPPPLGFSSDFTGYPTSLEATAWAPPPAVPPPNPMPPPSWGQNPYTAWNAFTQPLPGQPLPGQPMPGQPMHGQPMHGQPMHGQPMPGQHMHGQPMHGQPMHGQPIPGYHAYASPNPGWLYTPAAAAWPAAMPPQSPYGGYGPQWQHPTLQPPPMQVPGPPGDSARAAFRWTNNTDRMNPFTEGSHYGPVLEPFICKVVGAVIRLNPLLAPSGDSQEDYLRWNMVFQTSNCYRTSESKRSWIKGRKEPATHPRVSHIRIISRTFPWMINARAQDPKIGVTCGEILDAISAYLHADVGKKEYDCMPQNRKRQIWESYKLNRSTDPNVPGGVLGEAMKRLDYLGSTSRFGGLAINDDYVKAQFGDGLPCTFELKCLLSYPMTPQELREQQQRQENPPPRHRSRSRNPSPRSTSVQSVVEDDDE